MKVLLISQYHPELVRGGAQQVCYELFNGLQGREGVEVTLLAAADRGTPSVYKSGAGITGFDNQPGEFLFLSEAYDHDWDKVADLRLVEAFANFLRLINPNVVHFHHFLNLGIDMLTLTRKILPGVKIVFTAHEFLTICAADGHMLRRTDQSLCNRASAVRCHQCLPERAPSFYFMREMWMKTHLAAVDVFTSPSRFMIEQFVDWGLARDKFVHVANGQQYISAGRAEKLKPARNRFGFFGQMVDVKGLHVLLDAVTILRTQGFNDFVIEINGANLIWATSERRQQIEGFLADEADRPLNKRNVVFNGAYHTDRLPLLMGRIDWVVVPSIWWEVFCLVVSEAWAFGRPVIASDVGGLAERITDGVDGLLFDLNDSRALAAVMRRACTEPGLWDGVAAGIRPPPTQADMVDGYLAIYQNELVGAVA